MIFKIPFGKEELEIEVPEENVVAEVEPKGVSFRVDEEEVIKRSLSKPIMSERISELAKGKRKVLIVVDDYTRPTPCHKILPHILNELKKAGVSDDNVKILVALGTHRKMSEKEILRKVGEEVYERIEVENHDWRDESNLVNLGKTELGTPIVVNKNVVESDLVIGVGYIVPHRVAGFSGGCKIIQPGVSGAETTGRTHWMSAEFSNEEIMGIAENPVRREIERIGLRAGLNFIVNVVLDREKRIVGAFSGHPILAHRAGAKEAIKLFGVEIPERVDIVVADSHPADWDLWQAAKGLYSADLAVKKGGCIVFITPCWEGVSKEHPEVLEFGYRGYEEVKKLVENGVIKDLTAAAHIVHVGRTSAEKAKVIMYSEGIGRKECERLGFEYASTPQDAFEKAIEVVGKESKVIIMKYAAELLPIVKKS
ncbi:MAG: nickel-dependent lactate racemase [Candidatus Asgardarchaeia archaeon]